MFRLEPKLAERLSAALQRRGRFVDQLLDDRRDRLLAGDHADRLPGHNGAALDVAINYRAAECTRQ